MSKTLKTICRLALAAGLILQIFNNAPAQEVRAKIRIDGTNALVEGEFAAAPAAPNLSFAKSYAGVENLGARVSDCLLFGAAGENVSLRKLANGEFLAAAPFRRWRCRVELAAAAAAPAARAHVSHLAAAGGILMLGDLLPEAAEKRAARVTIEAPAGWRVATLEPAGAAANEYLAADADRAVFYLGADLRARAAAVLGGARLELVMSGDWQVSEDEAARAAAEIFAHYEKLFGGRAADRALVYLGKFPPGVAAGRWEAETRGANVTVFSSELSFKTQSLQRLHEQLRHEIFHLWFPNGVNLAGNYDWFYEGFALYASLRAAVALRRIRFEDFLDTLARAHSIDTLQSRRVSLVEASKNRWSGANTQVYARGMLVAFLADLALLRESKGRDSLAALLRELYRAHGAAAPRADGNAVVLAAFDARRPLRAIAERYVKGAADIDWQTDLAAAGIESTADNFTTKLRVKTDLNGRQKDLLDELGYNNWRKNSE